MPVVNSQEWYEALYNAINASKEYEEAARDWEGDMIFVIEGDGRSPYVPAGQSLAFHIDLHHGKCRAYKQLAREDEMNAAYKIRGPASVWEAILCGLQEPTQALLQGQLTLEGDMARILRYVGGVQAMVDVLNVVPTEWPKGKPPDYRV
ncbi:MAG: SCP2 sterol-binding domain-containing protein [Halobacteria archaeon]